MVLYKVCFLLVPNLVFSSEIIVDLFLYSPLHLKV